MSFNIDEKRMVMKVELLDDEDAEYEAELPITFDVCGRCEGRGKHSNPNIDGHGITSDEWNGPDWDDESRETYMSGGYDIQCLDCEGRRVIPEVDESKCDPDDLKRWNDKLQAKAEIEAEERMERRYCGDY